MNRFVRFAAVLPLLTLAALAHAAIKIEHWTAPSGARVYFVETRVLPIVDVQVSFSAGSAYDPAEKVGLASLTRALLDAGAGDLDEEKIADRLVDTGARLSGSTDPDRASVTLRTLSSRAERDAACDLLRLVLQQPRFPASVLEREKSRTIAGIRESDTQPDSIAAKRFSAAMYPSHPYGFNATAETVTRIQRDDLERFYRQYFTARRSTVAIVGDLSRSEAEALAQRLTDGLPQSGGGDSLPPVQLPARGTLNVDHPASQSHIYVGMPGMSRIDPDYFPLLVGNYILGGGGFVSRLLKEVREKRGFAYSVYSFFQPYSQPGPFQIGLQTKRDQSEAALQVVEQTLNEFLAKGPTEEELKGAKRNLIDGFALRLDSNKKILDHVAMIGFYGLPLDWLDQYPKRVDKVTAAQVRDAFARRIRPEHLVTVIVAGKT
jgi:zinc protease